MVAGIRLWHLLSQAGGLLLSWMGTTLLAVIVGLLITFGPFIASVMKKQTGWTPAKLYEAAKESLTLSLLVLTLAIWGVLYMAAIAVTIYRKHETLVAENRILTAEIARLKTATDQDLKAQFQLLIESGENTRDAFWDDLRRLRNGELVSHIDEYRRVQNERWRERLQQTIREQTMLRPEVYAYLVTRSGDGVSESVEKLKELLKDWAHWKL